jgi:hypothetical protein
LLEDEEPHSWQEALARDPEYYMNTKQGQEELSQMIRKESERLLEEIGRSVKPSKEIVWLSRHCVSCKFYLKKGTRAACERWNVRLVKPFYGKPIWEQVRPKTPDREKEMVVAGIDWDRKWKEISEKVVEWAVDQVNGGFPYFCFTQ